MSTLWWFRTGKAIHRVGIPGTEDIVTGNSTADTFRNFEASCEARGLKFDNILTVFHHQACLALPEGLRAKNCTYLDESAPLSLRQPRLLGYDDVKAFFKKAWAWWKSEEIVSQTEADRRALICASCPLNAPASIGGCDSCTGIASELAADLFSFIGDKKTASDAHLAHCSICGCNLRLICHAPLSALKLHEEHAGQYPSHCWRG